MGGAGAVSRKGRLPNTFVTGGERVRASYRTRQALRSREVGARGDAAEGTPKVQRRYFGSEVELARTLEGVERRGGDAMADLRAMGSVFVGERGARQALTADEAMRLIRPDADISPPHVVVELSRSEISEVSAPTTGKKTCPWGCGELVAASYGACAECAARRVAGWKARRKGR